MVHQPPKAYRKTSIITFTSAAQPFKHVIPKNNKKHTVSFITQCTELMQT